MSSFPQILRHNRARLAGDISAHPWLVWYSPAERTLRWAIDRRLDDHLRGAVLDAGAGFMPYRSRILLGADSYVSLDMEAAPGVDVLGDVTRMTDIADDTFDVVLCLEVLEHLSTPAAAASEIARVLRPGGTAIISVPHLSRIHDAPHDYFRFTRYGLSRIASDAGLTIDSVDDVGSVFSLLGHQLATLLAPLCWGVPILRWVAFAVATTLVTLPSIALDALPGLRALLPLNVVLVAHKSGPPTG